MWNLFMVLLGSILNLLMYFMPPWSHILNLKHYIAVVLWDIFSDFQSLISMSLYDIQIPSTLFVFTISINLCPIIFLWFSHSSCHTTFNFIACFMCLLLMNIIHISKWGLKMQIGINIGHTTPFSSSFTWSISMSFPSPQYSPPFIDFHQFIAISTNHP